MEQVSNASAEKIPENTRSYKIYTLPTESVAAMRSCTFGKVLIIKVAKCSRSFQKQFSNIQFVRALPYGSGLYNFIFSIYRCQEHNLSQETHSLQKLRDSQKTQRGEEFFALSRNVAAFFSANICMKPIMITNLAQFCYEDDLTNQKFLTIFSAYIVPERHIPD